MLCPVDDSPLAAGSFEGYPIHRCPQCLGVSVGGSLLREVRAHAALELHKGQGDASLVRPCPSDGTGMKLLEFRGVPICACPKCLRLWLSSGIFSGLLEVTPSKKADLSHIGQSLNTAGSCTDLSELDNVGDILELAGDVFDVIGNLTD